MNTNATAPIPMRDRYGKDMWVDPTVAARISLADARKLMSSLEFVYDTLANCPGIDLDELRDVDVALMELFWGVSAVPILVQGIREIGRKPRE